MDNMPSATEIAVKEAKENNTRKILALAKEAKSTEELIQKLEALLEK